jgi:2-aminoethylphosphonate-pyruvate transaminase
VNDKSQTIENLVAERNQAKLLFTAGPASLLPENLTGLRPCFGRGDEDYARVELQVLDSLKAMTGHRQIARMQGSASLALEIAALNFLYGRVLVVSTGYYSDRLKWLAESAQRRTGEISFVAALDWSEMESVSGQFDWIVACYTETSCALKLPIESLLTLRNRLGARLMLDATASIGLESGHEIADVIAYSSCKGLFGLTGAAFIAFNEKPTAEPDSLYLNLETHLEKRVTGPYHAIASLLDVLPRHGDFKAAVIENTRIFMGKMASRLSIPGSHQPALCTRVDGEIVSADPRAVLYKPRGNQGGSVVCHLGEAHLERQARGEILDVLQLVQQ